MRNNPVTLPIIIHTEESWELNKLDIESDDFTYLDYDFYNIDVVSKAIDSRDIKLSAKSIITIGGESYLSPLSVSEIRQKIKESHER